MSAKAAVAKVAKQARSTPVPARDLDLAEARLVQAARPLLADMLRQQSAHRAMEREIEHAAKLVANAVDRLDQAMFSRDEISARASVTKAAERLRNAMRKHGRA